MADRLCKHDALVHGEPERGRELAASTSPRTTVASPVHAQNRYTLSAITAA